MGKILKPRGLKGILRLSVFNVVDSALKKGQIVWVKFPDGNFITLLIENIKISHDSSWVKFYECSDRFNAEKFSGLQFSIPRKDFSLLSDNEFYLVDLIGYNVIDFNKNIIGIVKDAFCLSGRNLLEIKIKEKSVLVPFVDAHVELLGKKDNTLIVKNIDGLLN